MYIENIKEDNLIIQFYFYNKFPLKFFIFRFTIFLNFFIVFINLNLILLLIFILFFSFFFFKNKQLFSYNCLYSRGAGIIPAPSAVAIGPATTAIKPWINRLRRHNHLLG